VINGSRSTSRRRTDLRHPIIGILLAATVIRIVLSLKLPLHFVANSDYDDFLLMQYANLPEHFANPSPWSLVKPMSFPVFLAAGHLLGFPYRLSIALVWILAAVLVALAIRRITQNRAILAFAYLFTLYCPTAYQLWSGTRIYRNALIAPTVFITVAIMANLVLAAVRHQTDLSRGLHPQPPRLLRWVFALGFAFLFFYYLKEDSIWLVPAFGLTLATVLVVPLAGQWRSASNRLALASKCLVIAAIPALILGSGGVLYRAINHHYFGVWEVNTRNDGQLGKFAEWLYAIDDPAKTTDVWVPYSTLETAWATSPTLQEHPEVLEGLRTFAWAGGDWQANPVKGDLPLWALRIILTDQGLFASERQVEEMMTSVNEELAAALERGDIAKSPKFFLSAKATGRSLSEIVQLRSLVWDGVASNAFYRGYVLVDYPCNAMPERCPLIEFILNENLTTGSDEPASVTDTRANENRVFLRLAELDIRLYQATAFGLVPLMLLGLVIGLVRRGRISAAIPRRFGVATLVTMTVLLGSAGAVFLGVAWFSQWIDIPGQEIMKFYAVAAVPLFQLCEIAGLGFVIGTISDAVRVRRSRRDKTAASASDGPYRSSGFLNSSATPSENVP